MNILTGRVTERDLETLVRLERFKDAQLGFPKHQQGMRNVSAKAGSCSLPDPPFYRQ
jgi:hypothetical protein